MHRLPLVLVLAVLFLLPIAPARADEAVVRLEQRVEMLLDLVAKLRSEVAELQQRVAVLEALSAPPAEPMEPAEPEGTVPVEELIEEVLMDSEYVGEYVLDREATVAAVLQNKLDGSEDAEQISMVKEMIVSQMAEVEMALELKGDGRFEVSVSGMGPSSHTAAGTWTRDGLSFTLVTTHEDGEETDGDDQDEIPGTWVEHRLRLQPEGDDFVLVFQRKE